MAVEMVLKDDSPGFYSRLFLVPKRNGTWRPNNVTYTGAMSGDVYVWKDTSLTRVVQKAHGGPVFSMFTTLRDGLIVTGGKELPSKDNGPVKLWDQEMKRCRAFPLHEHGTKADVVKSVCRIKGKVLIGTKDNDVIEIGEKTGTISVLVGGHGEGEVWGLDKHPTIPQFITAGYDGTLRIWDITSKALVAKLSVGQDRSVTFSPDGEMIATGLKNGEFVVLQTNGLKVWGRRRDRAGAINDIRFSPNGKYLAVGSEDCCVDFYDISKGPSLSRAGYCKDIPSFVIQMDYSADSKYIRVSTGTYVHQIFAVPEGNVVDDQNIISKITWATWTSVLGQEVLGIWPKSANKADVNCSHLSHTGTALATGDDSGLVKLFDFPCSDKYAAHKSYVGHSAHVTNVRFTSDDKYLISTGGDDCCVFLWKCI